jgi:hypothetical protein
MIFSDGSDWRCHAYVEHEQVRSAPHCAALSGGQGGLLNLS